MPKKGDSYVLVLDDDVTIAPFISQIIGFRALPFRSAAGLMKVVENYDPVAVFVDIDLGNECGLDIVPILAKKWSKRPIFVITAARNDSAISTALIAGAIDYIQKPFSKSDLRARFNARRQQLKEKKIQTTISIDDLVINFAQGTMEYKSRKAYISAKEQQIMKLLFEYPSEIIARNTLKSACWGSLRVSDNALDRRVYNLRKALREIEAPFALESVYKKGFLMKAIKSKKAENQ